MVGSRRQTAVLSRTQLLPLKNPVSRRAKYFRSMRDGLNKEWLALDVAKFKVWIPVYQSTAIVIHSFED